MQGDKYSNKLFNKLYDAEVDGVFRFCFMRTSDVDVATDITQDVFASLWIAIVKRQVLSSPRAFIFKITRNKVVDWYRKKKDIHLDSYPDDGIESALANVSVTAEIEAHSEAREAMAKMRKLPLEYREVLYMRYVEDMKPALIAEILNESVNVVSVRIHRGVKKLKRMLRYD